MEDSTGPPCPQCGFPKTVTPFFMYCATCLKAEARIHALQKFACEFMVFMSRTYTIKAHSIYGIVNKMWLDAWVWTDEKLSCITRNDMTHALKSCVNVDRGDPRITVILAAIERSNKNGKHPTCCECKHFRKTFQEEQLESPSIDD